VTLIGDGASEYGRHIPLEENIVQMEERIFVAGMLTPSATRKPAATLDDGERLRFGASDYYTTGEKGVVAALAAIKKTPTDELRSAVKLPKHPKPVHFSESEKQARLTELSNATTAQVEAELEGRFDAARRSAAGEMSDEDDYE
jgi:hypothetical protein